MLSAWKIAAIRRRAEHGRPLTSDVLALLEDRAALLAQRDEARQGWRQALSAAGEAQAAADRAVVALAKAGGVR